MKAGEYRSHLFNKEGRIYLAACSHSPATTRLFQAMEEYTRDIIEYGNPWDLWLDKIRDAVRLFARLINASPDEVFPSFSVSSALTAVLSSLDYTGRNEIVVSDLEYPTTNFIFLAQRKYGARPITLRSENYALPVDAYSRSVGDKTVLTSAIHVSSMNGFRQSIGEICEIAHDAGSLFYTDAYQSLGTMPVNVKKSDVDFLASGNLKYLLGLPGIAFMYVKKELIAGLKPTNIGWFSQKNPFLFGADSLDYADSADRFQSGTLSIPSVYAAIAGMETILEVGSENIEKHVAALTQLALRLGSEHDLTTITPSEPGMRGSIVSFVVRRPHDLELRLREEGIITSSRDIGLRIAPHFYNTAEDVETAIDKISTMRNY